MIHLCFFPLWIITKYAKQFLFFPLKHLSLTKICLFSQSHFAFLNSLLKSIHVVFFLTFYWVFFVKIISFMFLYAFAFITGLFVFFGEYQKLICIKNCGFYSRFLSRKIIEGKRHIEASTFSYSFHPFSSLPFFIFLYIFFLYFLFSFNLWLFYFFFYELWQWIRICTTLFNVFPFF